MTSSGVKPTLSRLRVAIGFGALAWLLVLAGCAQDPVASRLCDVDADCDEGQVCLLGACVAVTTIGEEGLDLLPWPGDAVDVVDVDDVDPDTDVIDPPPLRCLRIVPEEGLRLEALAPGVSAVSGLRLISCDEEPIEGLRWRAEADPGQRAFFAPWDEGAAAGPLEPGDSLEALVRFVAAAPGTYRGRFTVTSEEGSTWTVPLEGFVPTPDGPCLRFEPDDIDFGAHPVGAEVEREVSAVNCGGEALRIEGFDLLGDADAFTLAGRGEPGVGALNPGESLALVVTFAPSAAGVVLAEVVVRVADGASLGSLLLAGRGELEAPLERCALPVANVLDFGVVEAGAEPLSRELGIVNCGEVALRVTSASIEPAEGPFALVEVPEQLEPAAFGAALVSLVPPTTLGQIAATVVIRFDGLDDPVRFRAIAEVVPPVLPPGCVRWEGPSVVDFGRIALGQGALRTLTVVNCGERRVVLTARRVEGSAALALVGDLPLVLEGGARAEVSASADTAGQAVGTLASVWSLRDSAVGVALEARLRAEVFSPVTCVRALGVPTPWALSLAFGQTRVETLVLENCGSEAVELSRPRWAGEGVFASFPAPRLVGGARVTLEPGAQARVEATLVGSQPGTFSGGLLWDAQVVGEGTAIEEGRLPATIVVAPPAGACLEVTPPALALRPTLGTQVQAEVSVRNCEANRAVFLGARFEIASPEPGFSFSVEQGQGRLLNPGETRRFVVRYDAVVPGSYSAVLVIASTLQGPDGEVVGEERFDVPVRADVQVQPPCVRVEPEFDERGPVVIDTALERQVRIVHCGTVTPARITEVRIVDGGASYSLVSPTGVPLVLQPGQAHVVTVRFLGSAPGTYDGTLRVSADFEGNTAEPLVREAFFRTSVVPPTPCLQVTPALLDLGDVSLGATGEGVFQVRNCGTSDLRLERFVVVEGAPRFVAPSLQDAQRLLAPGATRNFVVRFSSAQPGLFTGSLRTDATTVIGAVATSATINLAARVPEPTPCLEATPASLDFGQIAVRASETRTVSLRNCGATALELDELRISVGEAVFALSPLASGARTVAPGSSVTLTVTARSTSPGTFTGELLVVGRPSAGTLRAERRIPLRVQVGSQQPCLDASPSLVDFGRLQGGASATQSVELRNCGDVAIRVATSALAWPTPVGTFTLQTGGLTEIALEPGASIAIPVLFEASQVAGGEALVPVELRYGRVDQDELPATLQVTLRAEVEVPAPCVALLTGDTLDLGSVGRGAEATGEVRLRNCGEVPLRWSQVTVSPSPSLFAAEATSPELAPGATATIRVRFVGSESYGVQTGTLRVVASGSGAATTTVEVALRVEVVADAPCMEFTPSGGLSFGQQTTAQEVRRTLRVRNCGADPWSLPTVGVAAGEQHFRLEQPVQADVQVAPGAEVEIALIYAPTVPGTHTGTLRVVAAGPTGLRTTEDVSLSGSLAFPAPCISAIPDSVDFGTQRPGVRVERTLEVENCGDFEVSVVLLGIRNVSQGGVFRVEEAPEAGFPLAPGGRFVVRLSAGSDGEGSATAEYRVRFASSDGRTTTRNVPLRLETLIQPACLSFEPDPVIFPPVGVAETSRASVAVRNCGEEPIVITSARVGGRTYFTVVTSPVGPVPLAPGESRPAELTFSSPDARLVRRLFTVEGVTTATSAQASEAVVVEGLATQSDVPCLAVDPGFVDFGTVDIGSNATRTLQLVNCGAVPVSLTGLRFGADNEAFAASGFVAGTAIAPGETRNQTLVFAPTRAGGISTDLFVESSAGEERVGLFGIGEEPAPTQCVSVLPTRLNFPDTAVNGSSSQSVFVFNCGSANLRVDGLSFTESGGPFALANPALANGFNLLPGAGREVVVNFSGFVPGQYTNTLVVSTAQVPGQAVTRVGLSGRLVVIEGCPTLSAGASREQDGPFVTPLNVRRGQTVLLDPGLGRNLAGIFETVSWTVVQFPAGTTRPTVSVQGTTGRGTVTVPSTGNYTFRMQYTRTGAPSCQETQDVLVRVTQPTGTGDGLRFVLTWRTPGDPNENQPPGSDLDMHLVRIWDGQAQWRSSANDVFYANRNPDWGVPGVPTDDPELLRDETQGLGPEIIVHPNPARSESYLLGVHYWDDRRFGFSDATLRIFRDGVELTSRTVRIDRRGQFWLAARIDLEGEVIRWLTDPIYDDFPPVSYVPN